MKIAIIGGGGWGLALAKLLFENRNDILLWEYNPDFLDKLKKTHSNPLLLP
ncbi:MAG: glycerol-3-phosphate dehydrogenase, partial [Candidatus Cloacimonetes bacterium]|nr:glycerol-3-phosphate dehydrogenase [Candidatus Cloacimonadota bacterium]